MEKKILMIVAPENYRDEELNHPREVFLQKGYDITIVSKDTQTARGSQGDTTPVDIDLPQVKVDDYDAIVFVGGPGAESFFSDTKAHSIAQEATSAGKVLAAICIAPSILANAGVLNGKNATAFPSEENNLKEKGVNYTGEALTVDGKIVTASGPQAAKDFGNKIVELLEG
jgi:protease I